MSAAQNIYIFMDGGVIQDILVDGVPPNVTVIDYDTDDDLDIEVIKVAETDAYVFHPFMGPIDPAFAAEIQEAILELDARQ